MNLQIPTYDENNELVGNGVSLDAGKDSSNPGRSQDTIGYVDPNTDPSMLTREMKAKLYK